MIAYAVDPVTLHEVVADTDELQDQIRYLDARTHDGGYCFEWFGYADELIVLLLAAGDLERALSYGCWAQEWAKAKAEFAPYRPIAQARLAHVHQRRGEFGEATIAFLDLLMSAAAHGLETEALIRHLAGRNDYAQGMYDDAREHFARALALRERMCDPVTIAESALALRAAERRLRNGAA